METKDTQIARRESMPTTMTRLKAELAFAEQMIESGFLPEYIKKPAQALAIMQRGKELGLPPMEALSSLYVVRGKVTCDSKTMLALAWKSGKLAEFNILESTAERCQIRIQRTGGQPHTYEFTMQEARQLGLADKMQYKTQPQVMLQWRCTAKGLRVEVPDGIAGLYTHEELGMPVKIEDDDIVLDGKAVMHQETKDEVMDGLSHKLEADATAAEASGAVASPSETGLQPPYVSEEPEPAGHAVACPKCGLPLKERHGTKGRFLGCTGYPKCRHTESMPHVEAARDAAKAVGESSREDAAVPNVGPAQKGAGVAENQPSASAPPPTADLPIDQGQIDTIKALGKELFMDIPTKREFLAKYGVKHAEELTVTQADKAIRALRELVAAQA